MNLIIEKISIFLNCFPEQKAKIKYWAKHITW
jgi:hypothetical protein